MCEDPRPPKNVRWGSDQIRGFLELYKQYPCLWDSSMDEYTKRDKRLEALRLLAYDLQEEGLGVISPLHLKTKIKSIKDTYRFELNKVKRSLRTADGQEYTPRLSWFEDADCIWRNVIYGKGANFSVHDAPAVFEEGLVCGESEMSGDHVTSPQPSCSQDLQPPPAGDSSPRAKLRPAPRQTVRTPLRTARFGRIKKPTRLEVPVYKLEPVQNPPRPPPADPEDEHEKFGKYVAAQLRAMPERNAVVLQNQINNVITTERLNIIDSQQYQAGGKHAQSPICLQTLLDETVHEEG